MKIGIITSGNENLTLFNFLAKYDHDYVVYYDFFHRSYGDKTFEQSLACVQKGIDYLTKQKVDAIILPPIYELRMTNDELSKSKTHTKILPLFTTYVLEYVFTYSLVGKLGILGDFADVEQAQTLLKHLEKSYVLTANQKAIKKFHFPFAYRAKEVPLRKYYLTSLSYSNILVNRIVKFDLRYFKDAMVDTLIPLNYGYFHYQTTITKFLNFKKIRFHSLAVLETIFQKFVPKGKEKYSVMVAYTGHAEFLKREKRLLRLLQRGKYAEIQRKHI